MEMCVWEMKEKDRDKKAHEEQRERYKEGEKDKESNLKNKSSRNMTLPTASWVPEMTTTTPHTPLSLSLRVSDLSYHLSTYAIPMVLYQ